MMLEIGKHPRLLIEEGGEQSMVDTFSRGEHHPGVPDRQETALSQGGEGS